METDRKIALAWWTSGRMKLCQHDARQKYYPNNAYLNEKEIFEVWQKETNPELQETAEEAAETFKKESYGFGAYPDLIKAFLAGVKWQEEKQT